MREWHEREVCMAIKAYPNPVEDLGEAACTAASTLFLAHRGLGFNYLDALGRVAAAKHAVR